MGSRLLSRVIIILQFRTEFHHLPQTQLIWVVRSQKYESSSQRLSSKSLYPNVEPQPPPAQTRMAPRTPSKAPSSADMPGPAQLAVYRLKVVKPTEAESASGTTRAWVQQVQDQPTPGGVRAAPAQELAATAMADCAGPTTMHS